jgi:type III restriction enzyme
MRLKDYQQRALDSLSTYFDRCVQLGNADTAFYDVTRQQLGFGIRYRPVKELPGLPYVCLRVPTGGGKTMMACHTVGLAVKNLLHADRGVVLWLVPSNAIREQTLNALKDLKHPYHQALEEAIGAIRVLDIAEALYMQPAMLATETVIIISTMQAFRVEDTEGRKVYESSGALMSHFTQASPEALNTIDRRANGVMDYSLANVLRIHRPAIIVDEAHNARTDLSFEVLARFNPACIVEFTATPHSGEQPSNVLHSVSAAELHAESMIKMPIRLETRVDWKELLSDAVTQRNYLEAIAKEERRETSEYIRPIMLLQAQPKRKDQETLTVDVVKQCLLDDHHIPEDHIAVATGVEKGLEDIDLADPKCEIRYVITIQALREGWDCPFAYILCTVAEMRSATAVEQILGRVMRLPQAQRKQRDELNVAYAFAVSPHFYAAANTLADALVENGFNKLEAEDLIIPFKPSGETELLIGMPSVYAETVATSEAPQLDKLMAETAAKVTYDANKHTFTFNGIMHDRDREALYQCFTTSEGQAVVERIYRKTQGLPAESTATPAQRRERFAVPILAIKQGDLFEQFEKTHFLDEPWDLSKSDPSLSESEYSSTRPEGQRGEIRLNEQGHVEARFIGELHQQLELLTDDESWTVAKLAYWLDRAIPHQDIPATQSGIFLTRLIQALIDERGLSLEHLLHDKYRLKQSVAKKIEDHRQRAEQAAYQKLFATDSLTPLTVTREACFVYEPDIYPYNTFYQHGSYKFAKHYYPRVGDLQPGTEEFECAQFIDQLPEVKYWVRNIEQRAQHSFWLQTSTDKFYPDFVCMLNNGKVLVVEYKGADRWSNDDSKEKRNLGELWAARSNSLCLFIMPKGKDLSMIKAKIA